MQAKTCFVHAGASVESRAYCCKIKNGMYEYDPAYSSIMKIASAIITRYKLKHKYKYTSA